MACETVRLTGCALAASGPGVSVEPDATRWSAETGMIAPAEARIGRRLTSPSVAGVPRRTTRRVVRRSTIYVGTLPRARAPVVTGGSNYYYCGATCYQPWQGRNVVVNCNRWSRR